MATLPIRSDSSGRSEAEFMVVFSQLNAEVDALQRRAESPPEVFKRNAWATEVKNDSLVLVGKLDELAADALESAALNTPGAANVYSKVNSALESCATCHKLVDLALSTWSPEQSFDLCSESEIGDHTGEGKTQLLEKNAVSSVTDACEELNAGKIIATQGFCIVYSGNKQRYFLLYRSDKKEETFDIYNKHEVLPLSWRQSAGRACGDDGYHFGDFSRSLAKHAGAWAAKKKERTGYEFGDMFLKRCVLACCGGSAPDPEAEEIAKRLQAKRSKAYDLLSRNVMILELRQKELERKHMGGELSAKTPIRGTYARKYRKSLDLLEESIHGVPVITREFISSAKEHGDLKEIEDKITSILKVAEECERTAQKLGV